MFVLFVSEIITAEVNAKLHVFHTPFVFLPRRIRDHRIITTRIGFRVQEARIPIYSVMYVPISTFCCVITIHQRYRQTDERT